MNESVAACFSSWQNVSLESGGALIRSHVLEPLNAEVFLALTYREDYLGLNDRHALLEREAAEVYLGRYQMILDGRVMRALPYLRERGHFRGVFEDRIHVLP